MKGIYSMIRKKGRRATWTIYARDWAVKARKRNTTTNAPER
jgi:hypothetical protein